MINDVLSDSGLKNQMHTCRNQSSEMKENTFEISHILDAAYFVVLDKLMQVSFNKQVVCVSSHFPLLFYVICKISVSPFLAEILCWFCHYNLCPLLGQLTNESHISKLSLASPLKSCRFQILFCLHTEIKCHQLQKVF